MAPDPDPAAAAAVEAANARFYDAFERRDLPALEACWGHDDDVVCVHPGWPPLRGWPAVKASWQAILDGPGRTQFILTDVHVTVHGDVARVHCTENLLDSGGAGGGTAIAAVNLFVHGGGGWRMVVHHGSPILRG